MKTLPLQRKTPIINIMILSIIRLPTINIVCKLYMLGRKTWCQVINPFLEVIANTFLHIGLKMWEEKTLAFIAMIITSIILMLVL